MITFGKTLRTGAAAALLLAGITSGAQGYTGSAVFNNRLSGMQLRGRIVCTGCSLAEVQEAQPEKWGNHLYRMTYRQQQVVIEVDWISNPLQWNRLITTPHLQLRGADSLFEQLTAEANRFQEVEVSGMLFSSQTLDMHKVTILHTILR